MGHIAKPTRALLFMGVLNSPSVDFEKLRSDLKERYGPIALTSSSFTFQETDYYFDEMGKSLMRTWIGFSSPIEPERLVDIKHECNRMEEDTYSSSGKRRANLDPG